MSAGEAPATGPADGPGDGRADLPPDLPAGWLVRRPDRGDVDRILALVTACDVAAHGSPDVSRADIESDVLTPRFDREHNQLLVLDGPGADARALAWTWAYDRDPGHADADLYVDRTTLPRERTDALAAWGWARVLDRCAAFATAHGRPVTSVTSGAYDTDPLVQGHLAAQGFTWTRTFWRMRRDVTPADVVAPPPPPGVTVRPVAPDGPGRETDLRTVHRLHDEAFADHWNSRPVAWEKYRAGLESLPGYDPALMWLGEVDGEPVGVCYATLQMADEGALYVDTVGVARAGRRRGVARALLAATFAAAAARGFDAVVLNVDGDSPTGATRVYEAAGMHAAFGQHIYQRDVPAG